MNRREFSAATAFVLAATAFGLPGAVLAQGKKPEEGTDYQKLGKTVPVDAPPGKVELIEFFWYACPHCNALEPRLEAWLKKIPPDVAFKRVPVAFRDDFVPQQRLYYALEAMGKVDELHAKVFNAIHNNHEALNKEDLILAWVAKQGLDPAKFKELYNSFSVSSKARRATQLQDAYKVQGVPAFGVAGRYYVEGEQSLQVVDYLVAEVRKSR
jgi:thiol:disulfide interchange protein DsbA